MKSAAENHTPELAGVQNRRARTGLVRAVVDAEVNIRGENANANTDLVRELARADDLGADLGMTANP